MNGDIIEIKEVREVGADETEYYYVDITIRVWKKLLVYLNDEEKEKAKEHNNSLDKFHLGKAKLEQDIEEKK